MRRPPQPSGEALTSTQVIRRVVTHPTQVVETLRRRPERKAYTPTRASRIRARWTCATGTLFGALVAVLGFSTGSPIGAVAGVLLLSGSLAFASLVDLLTPDKATVDEHVWHVAQKWANR